MSGLPLLTENICQELHKANLTSLLVPDTTVSRRKGPILTSIPLYPVKAEIVGISLTI